MEVPVLIVLARARHLGRRVRLAYLGAGAVATEREVDVLGLRFNDAHWYAFVHCHLRRAVRLLRVDRVLDAHSMRRRARARPPRSFDHRFFASSEFLDPGAPVTRLATVHLEGRLVTAAPALFPSALTERVGRTLLCHLRVSRPAVLAALVESLGEGATLVGGSRDKTGARAPGQGS